MSAAALAAYMASLPVSLLLARQEVAMLPESLERFGIRTLGELAKLPRDALADRFGAAGAIARDLAQGRDTPLVPRSAAERLEERLELPESASGAQLQRGLELLVDRLRDRRLRRRTRRQRRMGEGFRAGAARGARRQGARRAHLHGLAHRHVRGLRPRAAGRARGRRRGRLACGAGRPAP